MGFSYENLWKLLKVKDISKQDLKEITGMSSATIAKLGKNENINMNSLDKICEVLKCDVKDIIKHVPKFE